MMALSSELADRYRSANPRRPAVRSLRQELFVFVVAVAAGLATTAAPAEAQSFTEYTVPTGNSGPCGITVGPDSNLWSAEMGGNKIGRVKTTRPPLNSIGADKLSSKKVVRLVV
jgi:hypothetical protein